MKLTKEDYMKLGLERCAELLVERDNEAKIESTPFYLYNPTPIYDHPRIIQEYTTTGNVIKKED